MRNRYAILAISLGILGFVIFLLFVTGAKPVTLELSDINKFIGASNGKVYVMIGDKLVEKELDGKTVRIVEADVSSASLNPFKHQVFITQTKNSTLTGKIISLDEDSSKDYPNAVNIYWLGDNPVVQTRVTNLKKVITTQLTQLSNSSNIINLATMHDTPFSFGQNLALLVEAGPETDDINTESTHLIELYDGSTLKKIKESVINGEMSKVQSVGGQLFYTKQGTPYQLGENLEEKQVEQPVVSHNLATSQDNKVINLVVKDNKLNIWLYKDGNFVNKGSVIVNESDRAISNIMYAVYDKDSKKIVFQSGDSIYSFKFEGLL